MKPALKQKMAYDQIRSMLVSGRLAPGTRLSNRALAKLLGISQIPVREAISQLATEGLVRYEPGSGAFVMRPSRKELEDLYELREVLECYAVDVAVARLGTADLDEMREHNLVMREIAASIDACGESQRSEEDADRWVLADASLHLALLRVTQNRRIVTLVGDLRLMARIFGRGGKSQLSVAHMNRICDEHDAFVDALRDRDAGRARALLATHIRTGCGEAIRALNDWLLEEGSDTPADSGYAVFAGGTVHQLETKLTDADPDAMRRRAGTETESDHSDRERR